MNTTTSQGFRMTVALPVIGAGAVPVPASEIHAVVLVAGLVLGVAAVMVEVVVGVAAAQVGLDLGGLGAFAGGDDVVDLVEGFDGGGALGVDLSGECGDPVGKSGQ